MVYMHTFIFIIITMVLLFLQLYCFQYWQYATPHFLLAYFAYTLCYKPTHINIISFITLAEIYSFVQTGFWGIIYFLIVPLFFLFKKIKKNIQIEYLIPSIIITIFCLCYALCIKVILKINITGLAIAQQIIMTNVLYFMYFFIKSIKKRAT